MLKTLIPGFILIVLSTVPADADTPSSVVCSTPEFRDPIGHVMGDRLKNSGNEYDKFYQGLAGWMKDRTANLCSLRDLSAKQALAVFDGCEKYCVSYGEKIRVNFLLTECALTCQIAAAGPKGILKGYEAAASKCAPPIADAPSSDRLVKDVQGVVERSASAPEAPQTPEQPAKVGR